MKSLKRLRIYGIPLLSGVVLLASLIGCTPKATYPDKPVSLIVPFAPGGTTDLNARKLSIYLKKHLGQPVTVVNKTGASGAIGTKFVYDAPSDGYTILYSAESPGTFQVMGISELSYKDFLPIEIMVNDPKVVVVNGDSSYSSIDALVSDIRARPGKVRMSYSGPGASGHIQGLLYGKAGLQISMTAFGGGNPALLAVMGNQVEFTNANLSSVVEYIRSGKLRLLAIFSDERDAAYPDTPAITESLPELKGYLPLPFPQSILVKKDTPPQVVEILTKAVKASLAEPEWKDFLKAGDMEPLYERYTTPKAIADFFDAWTSSVSWLLYDYGVAANNPEKYGIPRPASK